LNNHQGDGEVSKASELLKYGRQHSYLMEAAVKFGTGCLTLRTYESKLLLEHSNDDEYIRGDNRRKDSDLDIMTVIPHNDIIDAGGSTSRDHQSYKFLDFCNDIRTPMKGTNWLPIDQLGLEAENRSEPYDYSFYWSDFENGRYLIVANHRKFVGYDEMSSIIPLYRAYGVDLPEYLSERLRHSKEMQEEDSKNYDPTYALHCCVYENKNYKSLGTENPDWKIVNLDMEKTEDENEMEKTEDENEMEKTEDEQKASHEDDDDVINDPTTNSTTTELNKHNQMSELLEKLSANQSLSVNNWINNLINSLGCYRKREEIEAEREREIAWANSDLTKSEKESLRKEIKINKQKEIKQHVLENCNFLSLSLNEDIEKLKLKRETAIVRSDGEHLETIRELEKSSTEAAVGLEQPNKMMLSSSDEDADEEPLLEERKLDVNDEIVEKINDEDKDDADYLRLVKKYLINRKPFTGTMEGFAHEYLTPKVNDNVVCTASLPAITRLTNALETQMSCTVHHPPKVTVDHVLSANVADTVNLNIGTMFGALPAKHSIYSMMNNNKNDQDHALVDTKNNFHVGGSSKKFKQEHLLLHGPAGTGKTMMVRSLSQKHNIPYVDIQHAGLTSNRGGAAGAKITTATLETIRMLNSLTTSGPNKGPGVLCFIDEIDAITPARKNGIGAELMRHKAPVTLAVNVFMEGGANKNKFLTWPMMIGATNNIDQIDDAILSRFTYQIPLLNPDRTQFEAIARNQLNKKGVYYSEDEFNELIGDVSLQNSGRAIEKATTRAMDLWRNRLVQALKDTRDIEIVKQRMKDFDPDVSFHLNEFFEPLASIETVQKTVQEEILQNSKVDNTDDDDDPTKKADDLLNDKIVNELGF